VVADPVHVFGVPHRVHRIGCLPVVRVVVTMTTSTQTFLAVLLSGTPDQWALPGNDPQAQRKARALVRQVLSGLPVALVDDAEVVTSELVTNAARYTHSRAVGGLIGLAVRALDGTVEISIVDQGPLDGHVPAVVQPRVDGGLGLSICASLGTVTVEALGEVPADGHRVTVRLDVAEVPR
jgi:anti-sigma regulatory factor (Ser/Thr protein kinase)